MRSRLICTALAACSVATGLAPAPAVAREPVTILDATNDVLGYKGAEVRQQAFEDMRRLGVDRVRILVWWRDYAPKPTSKQMPAFLNPTDSNTYGFRGQRFGGLDVAVRLAYKYGLDPYIVPSGGPSRGLVPRWAALHPGAGAIDPRPAAYGDFLQALGQRYSGGYDPDGILGPEEKLPAVKHLGIYNEPNNPNFLLPQRKRGHAYSASLYRRLYQEARAGLDAAGWSGEVLIGETSPRGNGLNLEPLEFLRGVLCLNKRYRPVGSCSPLRADGWAHHPYALNFAPWERQPNREHVSIATIDRLTRALDAAAKAGALAGPPLPVFMTEFGYQSIPDRQFGFPLLRQAEYMANAELIAYKHPRIRSFAQYLIRDDRSLNGFQSGLRFAGSGAADCGGLQVGCKPAFHSFRATLAVRIRGARKALLWGHIRSAAGPVRVHLRVHDPGHGTHAYTSVVTDADGYFALKARYHDERSWGLAWDGTRGPLIRGYRY